MLSNDKEHCCMQRSEWFLCSFIAPLSSNQHSLRIVNSYTQHIIIDESTQYCSDTAYYYSLPDYCLRLGYYSLGP